MTELAFAQVREDPLLDAAVVRDVARRRGRPARVLIVASGGCTALGLLALEEVDRVVAVDASAAQLDWVELRREAMALLPFGAQRVLLGGIVALAPARRTAYEALRPHLREPVRARYDARSGDVEAGVLQAGGLGALVGGLRAGLPHQGARPPPFPNPAPSPPRHFRGPKKKKKSPPPPPPLSSPPRCPHCTHAHAARSHEIGRAHV